MSTTRRILSRVSMLAPFASLAILLGMSHALPNRIVIDEQTEDRKALVKTTMEDVPFFIEEWIGRDSRDELPPAAQKLLRPNAILSRHYQETSGAAADILIVHCSDARDMIGHFPPVCYPSAGWRAESEATRDRFIQIGESTIPVRLYRFSRVTNSGHDMQIRIFNAFVLPDGTVTPDISDINRQSERLALSVQGVAQLQVITPGAMSETIAAQAASELLSGMGDLFDALRVGEGASGDG